MSVHWHMCTCTYAPICVHILTRENTRGFELVPVCNCTDRCVKGLGQMTLVCSVLAERSHRHFGRKWKAVAEDGAAVAASSVSWSTTLASLFSDAVDMSMARGGRAGPLCHRP